MNNNFGLLIYQKPENVRLSFDISYKIKREMEMNQFINWGLAILIVFLLSACGTPLNDYHPKNEEEKEIKTLLVQFTENRNNYDVNNMASSRR